MELWGDIIQAIGWSLVPCALLPAAVLATGRLRSFARAVADTVDTLNRGIGEAVKWLMPALVLSVVFTVFALSIFGWASPKIDESAVYLHATALMLGMGAALLADEHVRVDLFYSRFGDQTKAVTDFAGFYTLLLPLMLTLLWEAQSATSFSWRILEGSPDADGIRGQFLLKTLIPTFAVLMIAQGIAIACRASLWLRSGNAA